MRSHRAGFAVIFLTLTIDVIGIGLAYPVVPKLVESLSGGAVSQASAIYGWLVALYALMQFAFGPLMGALSDRYGRRPVVLLSLAGLTLDYLILVVAPSLWWLAAGRAIGGTLSASFTTANAYVADISPPERRAKNFGILGAAVGIGFIAGPLVGGVLGEFGPRIPFVAAAALCFLDFLFAFFFLPESLPREKRRRFRLAEANPIGAFRVVGRYPVVLWLVFAFIFANIAERMLESIWVLYVGYRFAWGPAPVGLSFAVFGLLYAFSQGVLVGVAVPRLGDRRTLVLGLSIAAATYFLFAFATAGWMLYAIMTVYVLGWSLVAPVIQAMASRAVPATEQGILQGALASIATATSIVASPLSSGLFAYFIGPSPIHFPGAPFAVGAALFLTTLVLIARRRRTPAAGRAPAVELGEPERQAKAA
jgi:DHA1 family tetracycline resistance protein-like MFS transporter